MTVFLIENTHWLRNVGVFIKRNLFSLKRSSSTAVDINTNVAKDVILYKYDSPKFFKYLNICAVCQFGFWTYLSLTAFETLRDVPVSEDSNASWWQKINLGDTKYKYAITISSFMLGKYFSYIWVDII